MCSVFVHVQKYPGMDVSKASFFDCRVAEQLSQACGELPDDEQEAYSLTRELYGNSRMLLAVLSPDELDQVIPTTGIFFYSFLLTAS